MTETADLCDTYPRLRIAQQAVWEVDALLDAMLERMPTGFEDLAARGMCIRAKQLSSAIMDAMDKNGSDVAELYREVHASAMPEQAETGDD